MPSRGLPESRDFPRPRPRTCRFLRTRTRRCREILQPRAHGERAVRSARPGIIDHERVLPAPFGPSSAVTGPSASDRLARSSAVTGPCRLVVLLSSAWMCGTRTILGCRRCACQWRTSAIVHAKCHDQAHVLLLWPRSLPSRPADGALRLESQFHRFIVGQRMWLVPPRSPSERSSSTRCRRPRRNARGARIVKVEPLD